MKSAGSTYRFIALTMAFLMFFTSAGFAMDMHYCGGQLKSVSLFGNAKTCHDMASDEKVPMKNCPNHKKMKAEKEGCSEDKDCCSNKTVYFQSDQDQEIQTFDFVVSQQLQQFVMAYVAVFFINDFSIESDAASFTHYRPPLIPKDISVLFETFLL